MQTELICDAPSIHSASLFLNSHRVNGPRNILTFLRRRCTKSKPPGLIALPLRQPVFLRGQFGAFPGGWFVAGALFSAGGISPGRFWVDEISPGGFFHPEPPGDFEAAPPSPPQSSHARQGRAMACKGNRYTPAMPTSCLRQVPHGAHFARPPIIYNVLLSRHSLYEDGIRNSPTNAPDRFLGYAYVWSTRSLKSPLSWRRNKVPGV